MVELQQRSVHLVGATGKVRTEDYDGRPHLVVPVVAMVEGVIWAVNSKYPELVKAEELAITPHQWNGRRAFAGHPTDSETQISGNSPAVLARSFGTIFHTSPEKRIMETRSLEFEVYIDIDKAMSLGPAEQSVVRRLQSNTTVEVSIGAFIEIEQGDGIWDSKPYVGSWSNIVSDHIAFLGEGEQGACSIAAGCGSPRVAAQHHLMRDANQAAHFEITVDGHALPSSLQGAPMKETRTLKDRFRSLWNTLRNLDGLSDNDVRYALNEALRAVEPGFMGVEDVFPDESKVIYCVCPADEWKMVQRSYTMTEGGVATLTDDATEVEPITSYQPVPAVAGAKPSCGCHPKAASSKETVMKASTQAAIHNSNGRFTDADAVWLDTVPEDRLATLSAGDTTTTTTTEAPPAPAPTPAPPAPAPEPSTTTTTTKSEARTTEDWLRDAPPELRELVIRSQQADAATKAALVAQLKTAQTAYPEADLNAMGVDQLTRLASVAKIEPVDYGVRGFAAPRAAAAADTQDFTPPVSYPSLARK